jgi:major membrane immunogen (membrane-anchored lipoprotein)
MRLIAVLFLAALLAGCNMETNTSSKTSITNSDGSTTTTETKESTKNGVSTGTKTETTIGGPGGKMTVTKYVKKDGQWVKE